MVVAGGFHLQSRDVQASVELYYVKRDEWVELEDLPSPRVYFSLQVKYITLKPKFLQVTVTAAGSLVSALGGYFRQGSSRVYPGQASVLWNGAWSQWTQGKDEEDYSNQRASFMSAKVSPDFARSLCTA